MVVFWGSSRRFCSLALAQNDEVKAHLVVALVDKVQQSPHSRLGPSSHCRTVTFKNPSVLEQLSTVDLA